MKHIEQAPLRTEASLAPQTQKSRRPMLKLAMAGIVFVFIGGYSMTQFFGGERTDQLSDKEKTELVTAFSNIDHIKLSTVAPTEMDEALNSMRLDPASKQQLKASLGNSAANSSAPTAPAPAQKSSPPNLVWLTLWDSANQDGDSVHVSSAGYEVDIPLLKAPQKIAVPVDSSAQIRITGLHDGGGGVTVGIQQGTSKVLLPVLAPGQVLSLPVAY